MKQNLYTEIWKKTSRDLLDLIIDTKEYVSIQLSKKTFEEVGNRHNYNFNLELIDGKVSNNIDGSAVARDLAEVILSNVKWKAFMANKHIKITLDKNFTLHIRICSNPIF